MMLSLSRASAIGANQTASGFAAREAKKEWRLLRARGYRRVVGGDLRFDVGDATKRGVPAGLQFVGHEAVGGVGARGSYHRHEHRRTLDY
jgi:hypothetical protein